LKPINTKSTKLSNLSKNKIVIAIDGLSSCGKSTLAKDIARELEYAYIDSGAMYRAVSLLFLQSNMLVDMNTDYKSFLQNKAHICFKPVKGKNTTFLNGIDVEEDIRKPEVSEIVSDVASNSSIRKFLVALQKDLGKTKGVVMDGRDIGTVVFPNAEFKLFVTADIDIRSERRFKELKEKGISISKSEVTDNLQSRDHKDSTRKDSPLVRADDAIILDTSHHDRHSQLEQALEYLLSKVEPH
jgi:cytidylate kinase